MDEEPPRHLEMGHVDLVPKVPWSCSGEGTTESCGYKRYHDPVNEDLAVDTRKILSSRDMQARLCAIASYCSRSQLGTVTDGMPTDQ